MTNRKGTKRKKDNLFRSKEEYLAMERLKKDEEPKFVPPSEFDNCLLAIFLGAFFLAGLWVLVTLVKLMWNATP